ncbi:MAG: hypothetical protein WBL48_14445 [Pseudolabrys sp.]
MPAKYSTADNLAGLPSRLNAQQLEIHLTNLSARIFEGQRKITVDAMPDLAPFRLDSYGLGDGQFAILGNADG